MKVLVKRTSGKSKWDKTKIHIVNEKTKRAGCTPWPTTESPDWDVQEMEENVYLKDENTCLNCWKRFERARGKEDFDATKSKKAIANRKLAEWNKLVEKARKK